MPKFNQYVTVEDIDFTTATPGSFTTSVLVGKPWAQFNLGALTSSNVVAGQGVEQVVAAGAGTFHDETFTAYYDVVESSSFSGARMFNGMRAMLNVTLQNVNENIEFIKFGWTGRLQGAFNLSAFGLMGLGWDPGGTPGIKTQGQFFGVQGNASPQSIYGQVTGPLSPVPDVLVADYAPPFTVRVGYGFMNGSRWPREQDITWAQAGSLSSYPTRGAVAPVQGTAYTHAGMHCEGLTLNAQGPIPSLLFVAQPTGSATPFTVRRRRLRLQYRP